ncbi:hypothetical protein [Mediterraneibacter sp.]|mgnify:FL=1|jgi:hypothetical protein|uniref:hypothetical protein n=1 Tax=Mediterraneibacter sp. TaxID=2316022 RepID=UPI0027B95976|nr:hypothetical protein [Mediterraneibacter sp.]
MAGSEKQTIFNKVNSFLDMELITPIGSIVLSLDDEPVYFSYSVLEPNEKYFSNVDAAYRLSYDFVADGKPHTLFFKFKEGSFETEPESGELFEAVSFYKEKFKLTLGCIASFVDYEDYNLDYDGTLCDAGIEIYIAETTKSQTFRFGVCWIENCTKENDVQTWYGADPSIQ